MLCERLQRRLDIYQTKKLAGRAGESARKNDAPGSNSSILEILAHQRNQLRVGYECLEVISIGDGEGRDRPGTGEVDQFPIRTEYRDALDVGQTPDFVLEHE